MLKRILGTRKIISLTIICSLILVATGSGAVAASGDLANVQISKANGITTVTNEDGTVIYSGADDADAIEAALAQVDSGVILFGEGTYSVDRTLRLKSDLSFVGEEGAVIKCVSSPAFDTGTGGYSSSTIPLASNTNAEATQIELSSVSGLKVGDYVKISDDFTVPYQGKPYKNGELAEIVAINGTTITVDRPLYDDYTVARNAKVRQISMFKNISFENIDFVGYGMDTGSTAISFYGVKNIKISNCGFADFGTRGINLFDCLDCVFEGNTFKRIFRDGLGYGIAISNACDNVVIKNNSFLEKGRHYVAIVASRGGITTDGFTRNVDILDNVFRDCADEAVNSHPTSAATVNVIGNEFYDSRKGVEFSRSDTLIKNNSFYRCGNAVVSFTTGNHVIEDNYFNGNRISVIPHATSNIIRNNVFDNGGYIMPELNAVIENNTFKNYTGYIVSSVGSSGSYMQNIEISNNTCEDSLTTAMRLTYVKNVDLNNNKLSGSLEISSCDDVKIDGNMINSPSSGVKVLNAKGSHAIRTNEIKAGSVGISLENSGKAPINNEIIIERNVINAPSKVSNDDYSNVIVDDEGGNLGTDEEENPGKLNVVQDSRLREGSPDTVFNDVRYIDVGGRDGSGGYRDLLLFDLSEYEDAETIENATLSLFWYYPEGMERPEDTVVEIYRPEAWNHDYVTWNSQDLNVPWDNAGGDWFDRDNVSQGSTPYATITLNGSDVPDNAYHKLDVTDLVKEYVSGKYENTGFLIKASTENGNYIAFCSSDYEDGSQRPVLTISEKE